MSDSVQPHRWQPTRLRHLWDSPGKNTGVGYHFLLQCMKVKSESEVTQSCPTLRDPMDCNLPGSSVHGIFQARVLEWDAIAFSKLTLGNIKQWDLTLRKPPEYKTWHHPTINSTLCRTPHLNHKENKNTKQIISRQDYHLTQSFPWGEKLAHVHTHPHTQTQHKSPPTWRLQAQLD